MKRQFRVILTRNTLVIDQIVHGQRYEVVYLDFDWKVDHVHQQNLIELHHVKTALMSVENFLLCGALVLGLIPRTIEQYVIDGSYTQCCYRHRSRDPFYDVLRKLALAEAFANQQEDPCPGQWRWHEFLTQLRQQDCTLFETDDALVEIEV